MVQFAIIFFVFPNILWAQERYPDAWIQVDPQEMHVIQISPYSGTIRLYPDAGNGKGLTEKAREALALVPAWIHLALVDTWMQLPAAVQDRHAQTVIDAHEEDPRFVDEVAFGLAHLPLEDLTYASVTYNTEFDPSLVLVNVRQLYALAPLVSFARLVEREEGTPTAYTTVELLINGATVRPVLPFLEMPRTRTSEEERIWPLSIARVPTESGKTLPNDTLKRLP